MPTHLSFSLWCDFLEKDFLERDFLEFIQSNFIQGATSNPSIFEQAFHSLGYVEQKQALKGKAPKDIYENLARADIQRAAELLLPIYKNNPNDGYVSIEVDPFLCHDGDASIAEGERLFQEINFPNVMIKIPATKAGYEAMEELIAKGISVNATLVFLPQQSLECLEAFKRGYKTFKNDFKKDLKDYPRAVISIFVSRFDRQCDGILEQANIPSATLGIKNAQRIYHQITDYALPCVRALFASTGVKSGGLEKSYYIQELIHPNAINTAPLDAIEHYVNLENITESYLPTKEELEEYFQSIKVAGIDMHAIGEGLLKDGLQSFQDSFSKLLKSLGEN